MAGVFSHQVCFWWPGTWLEMRPELFLEHCDLCDGGLDYADIIYDKPLNESLKRKIEMVQYNAALIITGAFKGTSRDKIYQEPGLESLAERRWTRKLISLSQNNLRIITILT